MAYSLASDRRLQRTDTSWAKGEEAKKKGIVRISNKLLEEMKTWDQENPHVISHESNPVCDVKKAFGTAAKRAGVADFTPHTLKHTLVT